MRIAALSHEPFVEKHNSNFLYVYIISSKNCHRNSSDSPSCMSSLPLRSPLNSSPDNNVGSLGTWCALSETRGTTENIPMNINNVTRGLAPICIAMPATDWAIGNLYWGMAAMLTALIPALCVTGSVYTLCYNMCKTCSASHHDPTTGPVYLISWEPREKSTFNQISTLLTTTHTSQNFDEY